jgi:hypothetical protein
MDEIKIDVRDTADHDKLKLWRPRCLPTYHQNRGSRRTTSGNN